MKLTVGSEFERLAREFFAEHPDLSPEWHPIHDLMSGDRLDLVCAAPSAGDVFATIRRDTIAVGIGESHDDFGGLGETGSEADVARRAFARFVDRLALNSASRLEPPAAG